MSYISYDSTDKRAVDGGGVIKLAEGPSEEKGISLKPMITIIYFLRKILIIVTRDFLGRYLWE